MAGRGFPLKLPTRIKTYQEQIHLLSVDASHIEAKTLSININCSIGGGQLSGAAALTETKSSLDTDVRVTAQKVSASSLNKFLIPPEGSLSGEIKQLSLNEKGVINQPRTWSGAMSLRINDVHRPEINFDRSVMEISVGQGRATLLSADIVQDKNEFHLRGTIELPSTFEEFGRTPANLEIAGTAPDLQQLMGRFPVQLTGSAEFAGKIAIANATIEANLNVTANAVGFANGTRSDRHTLPGVCC